MLKKESISVANLMVDKTEECAICSEFTLPDYCADMAVILKCFAYPRLQNRQWSGDKLLIDGNAIVRVLYLDAERRSIRSVEYALPFACALRCDQRVDDLSPNIEMETKYINCRALNARRLEVRGTVWVHVSSEGIVTRDVCCSVDGDDLFAKIDTVETTLPDAWIEKIVSVSDSLEFEHSLPPAHMLLGGECRATVRECKVLAGKIIVKGNIYLHQLYTDKADGESSHCLDYCLPYSQILDVPGAVEGVPYAVSVQVLNDTERCVVGPDGNLTVLDVTVKLLIQLRTYQKYSCRLVEDAYHCRYPLSLHTEEMKFRTLLGERTEDVVVTYAIPMVSEQWSEILDVMIQPQGCQAFCSEGNVKGLWKALVCVFAKDLSGEVVYNEYAAEIPLAFLSTGNSVGLRAQVADYKYHIADGKLELQIALSVMISEYDCIEKSIVVEATLQKNAPKKEAKATAVVYYAVPGESIWDVGRTCGASPEEIRAENDWIDDGIMDHAVLIVPLVN